MGQMVNRLKFTGTHPSDHSRFPYSGVPRAHGNLFTERDMPIMSLNQILHLTYRLDSPNNNVKFL